MNFSTRSAMWSSTVIDSLLPHLSDGQLLVLRSTLYPGTTDGIAAHLKRKKRDLKVAFCPERIVQGYGIEELSRMPQIVSGTTPEAAREATDLFRIIAPEIVSLTRSRRNSPSCSATPIAISSSP